MKIAAVKTGAIGDLIQITPALAALRKKYPESEISLICGAEYAHVLKKHKLIDNIVTFSSKRLYSQLMPFEALHIASLLSQFDKAYIFHTDQKWHFLAKISGTDCACSAKKSGTSRHLWHLKTVGMGYDFGYSFQPEESTSELPEKPYIAISAGGGKNFRRYTPQKIWDKQAELALRIANETDYCVALLGIEEEKLNVSHPKIYDYTGRTSLSDCFHIISRAERYIGYDSGLTHLAACTQTPITALFGATDPKECMPPVRGRIIMSHLPCAPCEKDGKHACKKNLCMQEISVENVFETIR
ncbi:glycosyltransferase family 9 protein [Seleniivibrio sp.]|uniref:glycosyltransferase family 9 protein n=1 Tax=Seleniivibrio sp. TaxID=2898801 RepID=UPI0025DE1ABA|nr:glycosyltransferase family 9 protein [Seleniivibrio sp.]MCD8554779.1 glycosyltransferase family 9 protein [Seleniivibrio sp.]